MPLSNGGRFPNIENFIRDGPESEIWVGSKGGRGFSEIKAENPTFRVDFKDKKI